MVQWVIHLPDNHEDLSLIPRIYMETGCGSFHNLSAPGEVEGRDRKVLDAHRLAIPAYTVVNTVIPVPNKL